MSAAGIHPCRAPFMLLQVPPAIVGLSALTLLDLSYNALHSLRPGAYLKQLVVRQTGTCGEADWHLW